MQFSSLYNLSANLFLRIKNTLESAHSAWRSTFDPVSRELQHTHFYLQRAHTCLAAGGGFAIIKSERKTRLADKE